MLTFVIWAYGSWYSAQHVVKGWHLLGVVPLLAAIAAALSFAIGLYVIPDGTAGEAAISAILNLTYGIIFGGIIAAISFWKRRRRERRDRELLESSRVPNAAPIVNPNALGE
jgi:hypothetical protein